MATPSKSQLLERMLDSDVKADLLILFNTHPYINEDQSTIARRISRRTHELDNDLEDLIDLRFLSKKRIGQREVVYSDEKRASAIRKIVSSEILSSLEQVS